LLEEELGAGWQRRILIRYSRRGNDDDDQNKLERQKPLEGAYYLSNCIRRDKRNGVRGDGRV
jgi:hypothetical protein